MCSGHPTSTSFLEQFGTYRRFSIVIGFRKQHFELASHDFQHPPFDLDVFITPTNHHQINMFCEPMSVEYERHLLFNFFIVREHPQTIKERTSCPLIVGSLLFFANHLLFGAMKYGYSISGLYDLSICT